MSVVVRVEKLSKEYRRGVLDRKSFLRDLRARWIKSEGPVNRVAKESFWALRDLSFEVGEGEVVGILGHNGAGKSTLLKILSQITSPTSGRIYLAGRVASLLEVGTGFHQDLTGRDNVFLNGTILGMTHREVAAKFDEIVAFSGVEQFIDTPVKRYSSGMRVRLAFAVAAHLEPEILLIDEVLAVGDAAFQQKCVGKIGEVSKSGRTVLFVSHNAAAVESLCTRGIVLEGGRLRFDGSQVEALRDYSQGPAGSATSLRERSDRSGSGEVRITGVEVRNPEGCIVDTVRLGEDVEICLHVERHGADAFPRLCAEILITTELGAPVLSQSNFYSGLTFGALPQRAKLICRIPRLPLLEGNYKVGCGLYPVYRQREPLDLVHNATLLRVQRGDFFGGGKLPSFQDGVFLVNGTWRMDAEPS